MFLLLYIYLPLFFLFAVSIYRSSGCYLSNCLIHLSFCVQTFLSDHHPTTYHSLYRPVNPSIYLPVLFLCELVFMSCMPVLFKVIYLFISLPIYLCVFPSIIHPSICPSIQSSFVFLYFFDMFIYTCLSYYRFSIW